MEKYICIDIGGTTIKYGLIDSKANILMQGNVNTEAEKGGKSVLGKVISIVNFLKRSNDISAVAISTAGTVNAELGEVTYLETIPDYNGINYKTAILENCGLPCVVENDANCAAIAEYYAGAAIGSKVLLMVTVGTGIGGSIIINGNIFRGFSNCAGEISYMRINGQRLQDIASTKALVENVAKKKNDKVENWNGMKVFNEAENGDQICIEAIDATLDILAQGIANVCTIINPDTIVLGGGIMERAEYLKDTIDVLIRKYLVAPISKDIKIKFALNKNNAGILGAFYNFRIKHEYNIF